jgi:macrolide-specific efflux system membrane fusion protein
VAVALALILVAGGGAAVWWFVVRDEPVATVGITTEPQVVEVTSGTIGETVSAEGTVAAAATEDLSFGSSGTVTSVWVTAGDTVTAGQVLATLDSAELESALAAAEADLADAEAQLDDAEDAGESDERIEVLEASVITAQDAVDAAAEALEGATLIASIDGLVTSVDLTTGEELGSSGTSGTTVTGSGSGSGQSSSALGSSDTAAGGGAIGGATGATETTGSDPQIQIVSAGSFVVDLAVDTSDIDQIEVGQEVALSISTDSTGTTATGPGGFMPPGMAGGFPGGGAATGADDAEDDDDSADAADLTATGLVSEISGVADASSGVATYTVTVGFSDDSGDIWAGSTATAEIEVAARDDVTLVSSTAVTTTDGVSTVTVALDGTVDGATEEREVTTGETSGNQIEIVEGLEPGDQVIAEMPSFGGGGGGGFPGGGELPEGFEPPTGGGFPGAAPSAEGGS